MFKVEILPEKQVDKHALAAPSCPPGRAQQAKSDPSTWIHHGGKKAGSEDSETAQTPHPCQTQPSGSRQLRCPTGVQTSGIMEYSLSRLVRVLPRNRTNSMCITCIYLGFPGGSVIKNLPVQQMQIQSLGQEDLQQKEMATHSSILAWEVPWTEEPGGL